MPYPSRRSVRLQGFDYAGPGAYFITVCTHRRRLLFGDVVEGEMQLNAAGQIVWDEWLRTATLRPNVTLDAFTVVPNHIHIVILLASRRGTLHVPTPSTTPEFPNLSQRETGTCNVPLQWNEIDTGDGNVPLQGEIRDGRERFGAPTAGSIPTIVRLFKSVTTRRINEMADTPGAPVWQRGYHEHVIRDVAELDRIRRYVVNNPRNWRYGPENQR